MDSSLFQFINGLAGRSVWLDKFMYLCADGLPFVFALLLAGAVANVAARTATGERKMLFPSLHLQFFVKVPATSEELLIRFVRLELKRLTIPASSSVTWNRMEDMRASPLRSTMSFLSTSKTLRLLESSGNRQTECCR
jgi:hypothetical protein